MIVAFQSLGAIVAGLVVAYLVVGGLWPLAVLLMAAVPGFVLFHRQPLVAVAIWLVVAPLVSITDSSAIRMVYWLVHRLLPVAALVVIAVRPYVGVRTRPLPRLGWPEAMMAGYVGVSLLSIGYTSDTPLASSILLYDRVFIPMCLYLIVRLLQPDEREVRRLVPIIVFILIVQSAVGLLGWTMPALLPSEWLTNVGMRTTGTVRSVSVFGVTVILCGLFLLHDGLSSRTGHLRQTALLLLSLLAAAMAFVSFSRGTWLAALLASGGALVVYRRSLGRLLAITVPVVALLLTSGLLTQQVRFASERAWSQQSEESALSRLPVVAASLRMFEAEPLVGWGYEQFDTFSRPFQSRVGNLVHPDKDHSSHNVYLTLLAEQGIIGFGLFIGPFLYWLARTRRVWGRLPADAYLGRRFAAVLLLVLASHVIVNNFSRMQIPFGLGLWWLALGMLASIVARQRGQGEEAPADEEVHDRPRAALRGPRRRVDPQVR